MKEICKKSVKAVKENWFFNKVSKLGNYLSSFLKFNLAIAMLIFLIIAVNAGDVIVKNGELNITNDLLVNTNTLFVNSISNRVGIGTLTPNNLLTIKSDNTQLRLETSTDPTNYYILLQSEYNSNHPFNLSVSNNGVVAEYLGVYADGGTNNRVVFPTGNVGIGTTAPTATLDVRSAISVGANAATTGNIRLPAEGYIYARNSSNTADVFIVGQSADDVYIGHNQGEINFRTGDGGVKVTVDRTGNVGIGDITPDRDLDIGLSSINSGDSAWTVESSINFKENIANLTMTDETIAKWKDLRVVEYNYKASYLAEQLNLSINDELVQELSSIRHKGLIAEEYNPLQNKIATEINYDDVFFDMVNIIKKQSAVMIKICQNQPSLCQ